jgi:hypothetical protein
VPAALCAQTARPAIDRRAVVERHNPVLGAFDGRSPLSVGNGEFAFTADLTGLQTFPALYDQQMLLCTLSQWGWHTVPNPSGKGPSDLRLAMFDTYWAQGRVRQQFGRAGATVQLAARESAPAAPRKNRLSDREAR